LDISLLPLPSNETFGYTARFLVPFVCFNFRRHWVFCRQLRFCIFIPPFLFFSFSLVCAVLSPLRGTWNTVCVVVLSVLTFLRLWAPCPHPVVQLSDVFSISFPICGVYFLLAIPCRVSHSLFCRGHCLYPVLKNSVPCGLYGSLVRRFVPPFPPFRFPPSWSHGFPSFGQSARRPFPLPLFFSESRQGFFPEHEMVVFGRGLPPGGGLSVLTIKPQRFPFSLLWRRIPGPLMSFS